MSRSLNPEVCEVVYDRLHRYQSGMALLEMKKYWHKCGRRIEYDDRTVGDGYRGAGWAGHHGGGGGNLYVVDMFSVLSPLSVPAVAPVAGVSASFELSMSTDVYWREQK
jgi:hypothetical protein